MPDYTESSFRQRSVSRLEDKYVHQPQSVEGLFVQGTREQEMRRDIVTSKDIFAQRYSEEEIPQEAIEKRVEEEYSKSHEGKLLSGLQKGKRASSAKKKIKNQKRLRKEMQIYIERREDDRKISLEYLSDEQAEELKKRYKTEEQQEFLQNWIIGYDTLDEVDKVRSGLAGSEFDRFRQYRYFLNEMVKDEQDYSYKSDKEFLSRLAEKYDAICRYASLGVALKELQEAGPDAYPDFLSISELRAKVEYYKGLKEHYDDRMRLMALPYYVLVSRGDLTADSKKDKALTDYIAQYEKCKNSQYAKGLSVNKEYEKILKKHRKESAQESVGLYKELCDGVGMEKLEVEESISEEETVKAAQKLTDKIFANKKKQILKKYPKKTIDFFDKIPPFTGDSLVDGMGPDSLRLYESKFKQILTDGKYNGVALKKAVVVKASELIEEYAGIRREYLADENAWTVVRQLAGGIGFDMNNPEFQKSEEYEILKSYGSLADPEQLSAQLNTDRSKLFESLTAVFELLADNGYVISEKYEERLEKEGEKTITENTPEGGYPEFKLNGRSYKLYMKEGVMGELAGKELTLKGKDGQALKEEITELTAVDKEMLKYKLMFKGESDERGMMYRIYTAKALEQRKEHILNIRSILDKNGLGGS